MNSFDQDTRDIAKGALVNFSGIIAKSISVVFLIVLTRLYGLEITGMFILARAGFEILGKVGALGLDRSLLALLSRHIAESNTDKSYRTIGQALFIGGSVTLVLFLCVQLLMNFLTGGIFENTEIVLSLRVIACAVFFSTITTIFIAATRAKRMMHYEVIVKSVVEPLVLFILSVVSYFQGLGFKGLCIAFLVSAITGSVLTTYFFKNLYSLQRVTNNVFNFIHLGKFFTYTVPVSVHDVLNVLLLRVDLFLVERFLNPAFVGIYGIAKEVTSVLKASHQSFEPIFVPVIAGTYQRRDWIVMRAQYQNVSRWVMLTTTGLLGFMFISIEPIAALFGAEFPISPSVFGLLGLSLLINGTMGLGESILLIRRPVINMINTAGAILLNLCLGLVLIPKFGLHGAALGTFFAYLVLNLARVIEVYFIYGMQPFTRYHVKGLLALALSGSAVILIHQFSGPSLVFDLIASIIFLILYVLILLALGLAPEDRVLIQKMISRLGLGHKVEVLNK